MKKLFIIKDYAVEIIKLIYKYAVEIFFFLLEKGKQIIAVSWEWFIELPVVEKLIIFTGIPAVFSAVTPIAKYTFAEYIVDAEALKTTGKTIFESVDSFYYINNPSAHVVALLGLYMFISIIFRHNLYVFIGRLLFPAYYLFLVLFVFFSGNAITKASDYTVNPHYFINFVVPAIYIILSVQSRISERN